MAKSRSTRLVIDASVAKQAGGVGAPKPASKACRDFLDAVLRIGHAMVWTSEIADEWKKHAAAYARTWRVQMTGRRKLIPVDAPPVPGLEKRAVSLLPTEKQKAALRKDLHLVYAALAADRSIVSMDETVKKLLVLVAPRVAELSLIGWINPDLDPARALQWLEGDCMAAQVSLVDGK